MSILSHFSIETYDSDEGLIELRCDDPNHDNEFLPREDVDLYLYPLQKIADQAFKHWDTMHSE